MSAAAWKCSAHIDAKARELRAGRPAAVTTPDGRKAWNQEWHELLRLVVEGEDGAEGSGVDAVDDFAAFYGVCYIAEPSRFTLDVAEECQEYATRYHVTLHDAIAEWEGDGPDGGFGLKPGERSAVADYLASAGHDLDAEC